MPTWLSHEMARLFDRYLPPEWRERHDDPAMWQHVFDIPDEALWAARSALRQYLFTFIREWNSFLWPLIVTTSPEMRTLSVGLTLFTGQYGTEWNLLMAAATVTLLPTLLIFAFAQRYFVAGIALTGFGGR